MTVALTVALCATLVAGCSDGVLSTGESSEVGPSANQPRGTVPPQPGIGNSGGGAADAVPPPGAPMGGGQAPDAPAVEPRAPRLGVEVSTPVRGASIETPAVVVTGHVVNGSAPAVTVNDQAVDVGADGTFSAEIATRPGINFIRTAVVDGDRQTDDERAFITGATADPAEPVTDALTIRVSAAAIAQMSNSLGDSLTDLDLDSAIGQGGGGAGQIRSIDYDAVRSEFVPANGLIVVRVFIDGLRIEFDAEVETVPFFTTTVHGTATSNPAVIEGNLRLAATPEGGLDVQLGDWTVTLRNFDLDLDGFAGLAEGAIEDDVRSDVERGILDALRDAPPPEILDPASLDSEIEVMGQTMSLSVRIVDVSIDPWGLDLSMSANVVPQQVVHTGLAINAAPAAPEMDPGQGFDLAVAAGFITRMLHAAWAGGALDFAADPDAPAASDATGDIRIGLLGAALSPELAAQLDPNAPLRIAGRALLPPVASIDAALEHPFVIRIGDLMLDMGDDNGPFVTVALQMTIGVSIGFDEQGEATSDLVITTTADVADTPRGPVEEAALELLMERFAASIPDAIAGSVMSDVSNPAPAPVDLLNSRITFDPTGDWLHLSGAFGP